MNGSEGTNGLDTNKSRYERVRYEHDYRDERVRYELDYRDERVRDEKGKPFLGTKLGSAHICMQ